MDRKLSMSRTSAPRRRKAASLDRRKAMGGYIFVAPFIIGLLLIYFPVIVDSFKYSLSSMTFDPSQGFVVEFVGLKNYQEAIGVDPNFVKTCRGNNGNKEYCSECRTSENLLVQDDRDKQ